MAEQKYQRPTQLPSTLPPQPQLRIPPPRPSPASRFPTMEDFRKAPPAPPRNIVQPNIPKRVRILDDDGNPILGSDGQPLTQWDVPIERPNRPLEDAPPMGNFFLPRPSFKEDPLGYLTAPITDAPSKIAKPIADWIDQPRMPTGDADPMSFRGKVEGGLDVLRAQAKGFGAGATQAIGDVLTQYLNPSDLAATALTMGAGTGAKYGLRTLANLMGRGAQMANLPVMAHGAKTALDPQADWAQRLFGVAEFAGGTAGALTNPGQIKPPAPKPSIPEKPFVPGYEFGPDGLMRPIPNYQQPDLPFGPRPEPIQRDLPFGERPPEQPTLPGTELPEPTVRPDPYQQQELPLEGGATQQGIPFGDQLPYTRMGDRPLPPWKAAEPPALTPEPEAPRLPFGEPIRFADEPTQPELPFGDLPPQPPRPQELPFGEPEPPVDPYQQQPLPLEAPPQPPGQQLLPFDTPGNLTGIGNQITQPLQPRPRLEFPTGPIPRGGTEPPPMAPPPVAPELPGVTQPQQPPIEGPLGPEPPPPTDPYGSVGQPVTRGNLNDPNYVNQLNKEAENLGLNPRHFSPEELEDAINVVRQYSGQGHQPITPGDVSEAQISRFPAGGNRTVTDVAKQISVNVGDQPLVSRLLEQAGKMIYGETNPARIKENFRALDELKKSIEPRADQSPDVYEYVGRLRDDALDKMRRPHAIFEPSDLNDISEATLPSGKTVMGIADTQDMIALTRKAFHGKVGSSVFKEMFQNGIDAASAAIKKGRGIIRAHVNQLDEFIEFVDNGPGVSKNQLQTVFIDLTGSGKRGGAESTIGEMGLGKTSYLTTGQKVEVVTVVNEPGKGLMQYEFEATPEQITKTGFDIKEQRAEPGTPTGTRIKYYAVHEEDLHPALEYFNNLRTYTGSKVPVELTFTDTSGRTSVIKADKNPTTKNKVLAQGEDNGSKYTLSVPDDANWSESTGTILILSNRGMFQGAQRIGFVNEFRVPDRIIVELDPKVIATEPNYPLIAPARDLLTAQARTEVGKILDETLIHGQIAERQKELSRIFNQMVPTGNRKFAIADRHGSYTPEEIESLYNNPALNRIAEIADKFIMKMSNAFKDRQLGTYKYFGYILDNKTRGINVKEPGAANFAIMLNPHTILASADSPVEMANAVVHLLMHEYTHTMVRSEGKDFTAALATLATKFGPADQLVFFREVLDAVRDTGGHNGYAPAIQEIFSGMGRSSGTGTNKVNTLLTQEGSNVATGGRPPETNVGAGSSGGGDTIRVKDATPAAIIHLASQGYEFKGKMPDGTSIFIKEPMSGMTKGSRPPILETPLGNQRATPSAATGRKGGGNQPPIPPEGTPEGGIPPETPPSPDQPSAMEQAFQLPRSLMAAWDMSAPLRQGLGLIHKKEFWQALGPMFKAYGSERAFEMIQQSIYTNPKTGALFAKRPGRRLPNGERMMLPSFAEDAGLKLMDLGDNLNTREEAIASRWAETGGNIPVISKAYEKTLGSMVRRGNRAYTTFLNKLRADTFASLIQDASIITGSDMMPEQVQLARDLANFVNTATGRGSLGSLEQSAKTLNYTLFAPRLIAARIQMLNPHYYWAAPKQVRMEALKSLAAIATMGNALGFLATMGGAEVGNNPNSSDFGKIKIGDTRIDPYGGFQQYIVAFNRLMRPNWAAIGPGDEFKSGLTPLDTAVGYLGEGGQVSKSSTSGKEFDLWNPKSEFQPTQWDVAERFTRGKLNPVLGFAMSMMKNQKEMSGEEMNLTTMNPMENAIMQRFLPIITQDLYELSQKNPGLMPVLGPMSFFGMGTQTYGDVAEHHRDPWR